MNQKPSYFEWTILVIIICLEGIVFYYRATTPPTEFNQLSLAFLSAFEITFSLYVGYFLQRIDSAKQMRESLRKYGFLAYRRVMDVKKSLRRSLNEIHKIRGRYAEEKTNEFDVIQMILEGTIDTVDSSIVDWGEIIEDEISKLKLADELSNELVASKLKSSLSDQDTIRIRKMEEELSKLKSEIPLALKDINQVDTNIYFLYSSNIDTAIEAYGVIPVHIKISDTC